MANTTTITRDVQHFTRIDLRSAGDIILTQGKDFSFEMTAEDSIIDLTEVLVEDNVLIIRFKQRAQRIHTQQPITYHITMPVIGGVQISGGGSLTCDRIAGKNFTLGLPGGATVTIGKISVVHFKLDVPGGAKVSIDDIQAASVKVNIPGSLNMTPCTINADNLNITVQGTANCTFNGRVVSQSIDVMGVVNIKAEQLQSDHTSIKSLGMSNIRVWTHETLNTIINGAGNIRYYGNPSVKKSISGFGRIKQLGASPMKTV